MDIMIIYILEGNLLEIAIILPLIYSLQSPWPNVCFYLKSSIVVFKRNFWNTVESTWWCHQT